MEWTSFKLNQALSESLILRPLCRLTFQVAAIIVTLGSPLLASDCVPFNKGVLPAEIISFVQSSKYLTVEGLLCKLPQDLLSQYSIEIYSETGAAQEASLTSPRIHLFNDQMALTFNGNSQQTAGNEIELAYPDYERHEAAVIDLYLPGPNPQVRRAESQGCLACHGSTEAKNSGNRFLFNAAPFWIGFLGASGFGQDTFTLSADDRDGGAFYSKELQALNAFKDMAHVHPRYKLLLDLQKKVLSDQEASYQFKNPENGITYTKVHEELVLGRVNLKYAFILAKFNHDRLASLILRSDYYERYRYAIFGSLIDCKHIETFLTPTMQQYHTNESFIRPLLRGNLTKQKLIAATNEHHLQSIINYASEDQSLGFEKSFGIDHADAVSSYEGMLLSEAPVVAKFTLDSYLSQEFYQANVNYGAFRYLFEGRLDPISMREWSIDPKKGFYRFNNKVGVDDDETDIVPLLLALDPVLSQLKELSSFSTPDQNPGLSKVPSQVRQQACSVLKDKSLKAFANFTPPPVPRIRQSGFQLIERNCVTCHTQNILGAPTFDFSSRKHFEHFVARENGGGLASEICDRISRSEHDRLTMPRVGPLLPDEINAIRAYMRSLGATNGCQ